MNASFPVARPAPAAPQRGIAAAGLSPVSVRPADLVLPMFIKEGIAEPQPVVSMPGVVQHTRDSLRQGRRRRPWTPGVGGLILFGIPAAKDARGSAADDPAGIVQLALGDSGGRGGPRHRADGRPLPG